MPSVSLPTYERAGYDARVTRLLIATLPAAFRVPDGLFLGRTATCADAPAQLFGLLLGLALPRHSGALTHTARAVVMPVLAEYEMQNKQRRSAANSAGTEQRVFGLLLNGLLRDLLEQRLLRNVPWRWA